MHPVVFEGADVAVGRGLFFEKHFVEPSFMQGSLFLLPTQAEFFRLDFKLGRAQAV